MARTRRVAPARQAESSEECRQRAIRLLTIRGRSRQELARALEIRGFARETVRGTLDSIQEAGLLDERASLEAFVAARRGRYGRERLRRELEHRGYPAGLVKDALASISPEEERRRLQRLVGARRAELAEAGPARRRLVASLQRRGFASELIREVLGGRDPS